MQSAFDVATSDSLGPLLQSNIFGIAVRLAFHDAGEYNQNTADFLGPDGCLSESSDHAGLVEATSLVNTVIEPIWQQYCDSISRADFWVLWAKMSAEKADPTATLKIAYQYGRKDNSECGAGEGRMPSAAKGLDEISRVFVTQMGLTLDDACEFFFCSLIC
jgi:catalase (peroxidase I)